MRLKKRGLNIVVDCDTGVLHRRSRLMRMNEMLFVSRVRIYYQVKNFGILRTQFLNCLDKSFLTYLFYPFIWHWERFISKKRLEKTTLESNGISTREPPVIFRLNILSFCKKILILLLEYFRYLYKYFFPLCKFLFYAIVWNLVNIRKTINARGKNFLRDPELIKSIKDFK